MAILTIKRKVINFSTLFSFRNSILISILIIGIRITMYLIYPFTSTDGPWAISATFSFMNGNPDYNIFAYPFLQDSFSVNLVDFLFSIWFKIFNVTTLSFIFLGFFSVILTVLIWFFIQSKINDHSSKLTITILSISYLLSPYIYGFRPEDFTILAISLMMLSLLFIQRIYLKFLSAITMAVLAGLIHHIGGLFALLFLIYYMTGRKFNAKIYFQSIIMGLAITFLLSNGQIAEYLLFPTKLTSETGNHFTDIDPKIIVKFFIYGAPVPFVLFFLFSFKKNLRLLLLFLSAFLLFLIMGRSYYLPYIFPLFLCAIIFSKTSLMLENVFEKNKFLKWITSLLILYSFVFFLLIPFILCLKSYDTGKYWREILTAVDLEEKTWKKGNTRYYLPSQLSMEVIENPNARLLYSFMRHNEGIQPSDQNLFYTFRSPHKEWVLKNFDVQDKKMIVKEILPPHRGEIIISSLYKFKEIRNDSIGFWAIYFE